MPSILIRAHKDPFRAATAEETIRDQLIGNNVGNLIFSQAVYRLLSTRDARLATAKFGTGTPWPRDRRPDRLVLPLANAFRPGYADRLDHLAQLIDTAGIPVTVLGVGAQATLSGRRRHRDTTDRAVHRFVRSALRTGSGPIGVRGEYTRDYLAGLGFGPSDVTVIGCPSLFTHGDRLQVTRRVERLTTDSPIALNISPYVTAMGPLSHRHAERYPRLVYLAQNQQTLELLLTGRYPAPADSVVLRSGTPVGLEHPLIREDRVRFFLDPSTWIKHLAGYHFSFGTRIHGNIAALLAGTPAVVLAHDSRTAELADYHAIPYRLITDRPDRIDAARLYDEADWEPLNRNHPRLWATFRDFLHQHGLRTVYDDGEDGGAGFDDRLARVWFPPAVGTPMGDSPEQMFAARRELHRLRAEVARLHDQVDHLRARRRTAALPQALVRAARAMINPNKINPNKINRNTVNPNMIKSSTITAVRNGWTADRRAGTETGDDRTGQSDHDVPVPADGPLAAVAGG